MKIFLLVFGIRLEAIKMVPLVKAFEKKNSIISKVCVTANVLLGMKDMLSDFNPDIVLVHGNGKACQRIVEYIKSV
ncbi:hypothetical protein ACLHDG_13300 [Sulfurovum sp. CS9]|uniref:hypothetical protein n=1 Tax=Sulfurovum sp. CS9 TaxID=3391146 RepID=UPI0039E8C5F8